MSTFITSPKPLPDSKAVASFSNLRQRIAGRLEQGISSGYRRYGLRRDLNEKLEKPKARIPISVRPLILSDLDILLPLEGVDSPVERQEIIWRRGFHRRIPNGCYVAVDERTGTPCYMQWLLGHADNKLLERFKCFPTLGKDEALLEQAYTLPSYRGRFVMPAAMATIAEYASRFGARYVLTFVEENNTPSIKGCQRAGFHLYQTHERTQMGFGIIVRNKFRRLSDNDIPAAARG